MDCSLYETTGNTVNFNCIWVKSIKIFTTTWDHFKEISQPRREFSGFTILGKTGYGNFISEIQRFHFEGFYERKKEA
jgi:hypothetical protein